MKKKSAFARKKSYQSRLKNDARNKKSPLFVS
jgi:hypothetical protein